MPQTVETDSWQGEFAPIASEMRDALAGVLTALFGPGCRPRDLDDAFGTGSATASRIHRAAFFDDEFESALVLPGRPTVARFIASAREHAGDPEPVDRLERAYTAFSRAASRVASTQKEFDALLRAHNPEAMQGMLLQQRAACFRAASDFAGIHAEVMGGLTIVRPNADDPSRGDTVQLNAATSLRRFATPNPIVISQHLITIDAPPDSQSRRIDGRDDLMEVDGILVRELCSKSMPTPRSRRDVNTASWSIMGQDLPIAEPVNLASAVRHTKWARNVRPGETGIEQFATIGHIPTKLRVLDYLVHKDMWAGIDPVLKIYQSAAIPKDAHPDDWADYEIASDAPLTQIDPEATLRPLADAPIQPALARYAQQCLDLDLRDHRAYRLITRYPILRAPIVVTFARR